MCRFFQTYPAVSKIISSNDPVTTVCPADDSTSSAISSSSNFDHLTTPKSPNKFSPRSIYDLTNEAEKNFSEFDDSDPRFCQLAISFRNVRQFLATILRLAHRSYWEVTRQQSKRFLARLVDVYGVR